jgi:flavin-dependent dehydrogenase
MVAVIVRIGASGACIFRRPMPVRATKRGAERTPLDADVDVLICGASFAGLSVARELAGSGARVMVVDRYEIGERQTSACAAPTDWLHNLGLGSSIRQTFGDLLVHTGKSTIRYGLPWTFSTFDYRELCALLADQGDFTFETAKVEGIDRGALHAVTTDRGELRAPIVVDALGWRRVLGRDMRIQPPEARLSRGLEVHPPGTGGDLELWIDPQVIRSGYGWSFPAHDEVRVGVGSFDPNDHVKEPTVALAEQLDVPPLGYQGNWIPHQLRPAVSEDVFFTGDSAGHCLPLTAEGIRTAFYFGLAAGREIRAVVEGQQTRDQALAAYGAFSASHARAYRWLLNFQHCVGPMNDRGLVDPVMRLVNRRWWIHYFFNRYLAVAPPQFAGRAPVRTPAALAR